MLARTCSSVKSRLRTFLSPFFVFTMRSWPFDATFTRTVQLPMYGLSAFRDWIRRLPWVPLPSDAGGLRMGGIAAVRGPQRGGAEWRNCKGREPITHVWDAPPAEPGSILAFFAGGAGVSGPKERPGFPVTVRWFSTYLLRERERASARARKGYTGLTQTRTSSHRRSGPCTCLQGRRCTPSAGPTRRGGSGRSRALPRPALSHP